MSVVIIISHMLIMAATFSSFVAILTKDKEIGIYAFLCFVCAGLLGIG